MEGKQFEGKNKISISGDDEDTLEYHIFTEPNESGNHNW